MPCHKLATINLTLSLHANICDSISTQLCFCKCACTKFQNNNPKHLATQLHVLTSSQYEKPLTRAFSYNTYIFRVWRSTWDTSITPPEWVLSPFPLPLGQLPRLVTAPCVLMQAPACNLSSGHPTQDNVQGGVDAAHMFECKASAYVAASPPEDISQMRVDVSVFGIVPDVCVRCNGSYLQTSSVMQARQETEKFKSGGSRTFIVS